MGGHTKLGLVLLVLFLASLLALLLLLLPLHAMSGLTKLGLALLVVFLVSLLAFAAELTYALCRRRMSRRELSCANDPELAAPAAPGDPHRSPTSKHLLLYFLCWKENRSRVEPAASATVTPADAFAAAGPEGAKALPLPEAAAELETELELAQWRGLHASRVLFTIREEEKEGVDSDGGGPVAGRFPVVGEERTDEQQEGEVVAEASTAESTPFSTPCASPPFRTPSSSPTRGVEAGAEVENPANTGGSDDDETGVTGRRGPALPGAVEEAAT